MEYALLIYSADDSGEPKPGTPGFESHFQGYMSLTQDMREKGIMKGGEPLERVENATTVRVRNGATETIDGPFAETKETLGGFYLIDCKDLDEAIEYAARIPTAAYGSIEIRPVMVINK